MRPRRRAIAVVCLAACTVPWACDESGRPARHRVRIPGADAVALTLKEQVGKRLFFDTRLSLPQGQSCATCHDPLAGFANPDANLPVSRGADPERFGSRNDLPAAYAAYVPRFHYDANEGLYVGGLFWDGRAADLEEQAKLPFLNPLEMANPDEAAVVARVRTADYAPLFREVFGRDALDDPNRGFDLIAEAIAAYERTAELSPFNSKYDLFLQGRASLTDQEQRGLALFEDPNRAKCAECHPSRPDPDGRPPLFTDFTYDNLGVPKNPANPFYRLPASLNPAGTDFVDLGLGGVLREPNENGKFRVPTVRNAARTGPYMHNGIFQTLREVVVFYNTRDVGPWPPPEVLENVNRDELGDLGLTEQDVDDLVAFLNTLTDGYGAPGGSR